MIRKIIRRLGFDIVRYPLKIKSIKIQNKWRENRVKLLTHFDVDVVIDVGANRGQFGMELRKAGYKGKIVSFEPLDAAFLNLSQLASKDDNWDVYQLAIGDIDEESLINVSENSVSSSILPMNSVHELSAPTSRYVSRQKIVVKKLDSIFDLFSAYTRIYLKLDVQGYEMKVLKGVENNFARIIGVQAEMSITPLYEGEWNFFELSHFFLGKSFRLTSLEPGFFDESSGKLLQVDGIWYR